MNKLLILGIAAISLASCSGKDSSASYEPPAVPVQTAQVQVADVSLYFEAMGTIKPFLSAEVIPQVNGIISGVHFTEGAWVEAGSLLYTIEDTPYAVRVQEMEALLAQDRTHLKNAQKRLERYKTLSKQDLIAKVEWDEMESKVDLCESIVKGNEARLAAAKHDLAHCRIAAPISGRTGISSLQAGSMVGASPLVTLLQVDPLYVDFSLTEQELQKLETANSSIEIYAPGGERCLASGKITFLDHSIDSKSGMLSARGLLSKSNKPLWPGQSVRVHVLFGEKKEARLIPQRAVKTNQAGPYVFSVKEDKTVELRTIKLGHEEKGMIVVEEGLEGAQTVVTEGHLRLFPGSKVEESNR